MKYEKPEIVTLRYAALVVKGGKGLVGIGDGHLLPNRSTTVFAYEADE